jgi:hypothetical protein
MAKDGNTILRVINYPEIPETRDPASIPMALLVVFCLFFQIMVNILFPFYLLYCLPYII